MTKKELEELLLKYEKGTCTPKEEELVHQFLDSFQKPRVMDQSAEIPESEHKQRIYEGIKEDIINVPKRKTRRLILSISQIAAVFLILIMAVWIVRDDKSHNPSPSITDKTIQYTTVITGLEEQKSITLSDGTSITINENSIFRYPETFSPNQNRKVELQGEAFFVVAKDSLRPFIAITDNIETRVLGTSFNIKAREEGEKIEISLVEGKVVLQTRDQKELGVLAPNEQFILHKESKEIEKVEFKGNLTYAWKEDIILFEKASVYEVMKTLSEKYKVHFNVVRERDIESMLVYRVDTKTYKIDQVLDHITKVVDYKFIRNADSSITIIPK